MIILNKTKEIILIIETKEYLSKPNPINKIDNP